MKKATINLIVDAIMFLIMMAIGGIGFLMKFVLLAGFERNDVYGKGTELFFWGMDRHEWGAIHLQLSIVLLILLALHIVLHWKLTVSIYKRMIPNVLISKILAWIFAIVSLGLLVSVFLIKPQVVKTEANHHVGAEHAAKENIPAIQPSKPLRKPEHTEHEAHSEEIQGYMTLEEVATKFGISPVDLAKQLELPESDIAERIGRLKKKHHFTMEELRAAVEILIQQKG